VQQACAKASEAVLTPAHCCCQRLQLPLPAAAHQHQEQQAAAEATAAAAAAGPTAAAADGSSSGTCSCSICQVLQQLNLVPASLPSSSCCPFNFSPGSGQDDAVEPQPGSRLRPGASLLMPYLQLPAAIPAAAAQRPLAVPQTASCLQLPPSCCYGAAAEAVKPAATAAAAASRAAL